MDLSIIVVSFNTCELLRKCLESIIESCKVQIIIVDNASSDGSVEVVKNFMNRNSRQFAKIRDNSCEIKIIENKENLGFAKAVNQGIKQAESEAVLLLNSDTIVKDGTLEKLIEFEKQVRPVIIGARLLNPDGSVQPSVFHLPTVCRAIQEYWLEKKGAFFKYAPEGEEPVVAEAVSGGAMVISKEVINKVGLLDERYFMFFEDLDYCRRTVKAGVKVYYLPSAEVIHEHGASGKDLVSSENQWRRLIPSSKIYHGTVKHYLINFVIWLGQKIKQ